MVTTVTLASYNDWNKIFHLIKYKLLKMNPETKKSHQIYLMKFYTFCVLRKVDLDHSNHMFDEK